MIFLNLADLAPDAPAGACDNTGRHPVTSPSRIFAAPRRHPACNRKYALVPADRQGLRRGADDTRRSREQADQRRHARAGGAAGAATSWRQWCIAHSNCSASRWLRKPLTARLPRVHPACRLRAAAQLPVVLADAARRVHRCAHVRAAVATVVQNVHKPRRWHPISGFLLTLFFFIS